VPGTFSIPARSITNTIGFTDQGYNLTINEGATPRPYSVWRKAVTSGSTVNLPSIGSAMAPFYFVIVE